MLRIEKVRYTLIKRCNLWSSLLKHIGSLVYFWSCVALFCLFSCRVLRMTLVKLLSWWIGFFTTHESLSITIIVLIFSFYLICKWLLDIRISCWYSILCTNQITSLTLLFIFYAIIHTRLKIIAVWYSNATTFKCCSWI